MTNPGLPRPIKRPDVEEAAHRVDVCEKADAVIAELDELLDAAPAADTHARRCA